MNIDMQALLYRNICERLSRSVPQQSLISLKEHYREEIASNRHYDKIDSIGQLLRVLERRDFLNFENIGALWNIAHKLNNGEAIGLLREYEGTLHPNQPVDLGRPVELEHHRNQVLPNVASDPLRRIYDVIAEEIGDNWKRLARSLGIAEGLIDQLQRDHSRISDRVYEILRYHKEREDERMWKVNLCRGLETARRKDLSDKIQSMFALHGLM